MTDRRLAALLMADVSGYSRMVGADEAGALAAVRALRKEVVEAALASHSGRLVKSMGDGFLVEFASAVKAVECAINIQARLPGWNAARVNPQPLQLRIGVHVGDVVVEDDGDVFGDGVNVTARLQAFAEPGSICLSGDAYRQVEGKIHAQFRDVGEQKFKNIKRPLRVYVGIGDQNSNYNTAQVVSPSLFGDAPIDEALISLVVLPFSSLGADPEQGYFSEGITEDLTTDLSCIPDSFIIAPNTALTYKGKSVDAKTIGRDLGVRYLIEGSVRRSGDQVRVNAHLTDTKTGATVWMRRFEGSGSNLFMLQDEIVGQIAYALDFEISEVETRRTFREGPDNPAARDLAMQGWSIARGFSRVGSLKANALFERALAIEPNNVRALTGLALGKARLVQGGWADLSCATEAEALADSALSLAPQNSQAHYVKAMAARTNRNFPKAVSHSETAISLNRNFADAMANLGLTKRFIGQPEECLSHIARAFRLSPRDHNTSQWCRMYGGSLLDLRRYDEAVDWLHRALLDDPAPDFVYPQLISALSHSGRMAEASQHLSSYLKSFPEASLDRYRRIMQRFFHDQAAEILDHLMDGLSKAGMPK